MGIVSLYMLLTDSTSASLDGRERTPVLLCPGCRDRAEADSNSGSYFGLPRRTLLCSVAHRRHFHESADAPDYKIRREKIQTKKN